MLSLILCIDCVTKKGIKCDFPFKYGSKTYHSCTSDGQRSDKIWCATTKDRNGYYDDWDYCDVKSCTEGETYNLQTRRLSSKIILILNIIRIFMGLQDCYIGIFLSYMQYINNNLEGCGSLPCCWPYSRKVVIESFRYFCIGPPTFGRKGSYKITPVVSS